MVNPTGGVLDFANIIMNFAADPTIGRLFTRNFEFVNSFTTIDIIGMELGKVFKEIFEEKKS